MKGEKTKKMLSDAIVKLSRTTPLDQINVADIAAECDVSRQTFYYHFKSVMDAYVWQIRHDMKYGDYDPDSPNLPSPLDYVKDSCRTLTINREFAKAMFSAGFREEISDIYREAIMPLCLNSVRKVIKPGTSDIIVNIVARFQADGCLGVVMMWVEAGMPENVDEVVPKTLRQLNEVLSPTIFEAFREDMDRSY